jgi:hypothetical protein
MPADTLALAELLAVEFDRRNMLFHLDSLRSFWADPVGAPNPEAQWTHAMVVEWLALFGVAPFACKYPRRPSGSGCFRCETQTVRVDVLTLFPGGSKRACLRCGAAWVERAAG